MFNRTLYPRKYRPQEKQLSFSNKEFIARRTRRNEKTKGTADQRCTPILDLPDRLVVDLN